MNEKDERELALWRTGPWVLKSEHDRIVAILRDQLTKALEAVAVKHGKGKTAA